MLEYLMYMIIKTIALTLPWRIIYRLAIRIAGWDYRLNVKAKNGMRSNLRVVLGEEAGKEEIEHVARETFNNFGKYMLEFFAYVRMGDEFLKDRVILHGKDKIDEARSRGKGVVIVSAHLSNWELGGVKLAHEGYPVNALVLDHDKKSVTRLFDKQRVRKGITSYPVDRGGRACLEALRRNELVCLIGDRDVTGTGIEVQYFGRPARFPVGPARFALSTGAPILPGFMIRQPDNRFELIFEDPLYPPQSGNRKEIVRELTRTCATIFEKYVRAYPGQFANFFPIWEERG